MSWSGKHVQLPEILPRAMSHRRILGLYKKLLSKTPELGPAVLAFFTEAMDDEALLAVENVGDYERRRGEEIHVLLDELHDRFEPRLRAALKLPIRPQRSQRQPQPALPRPARFTRRGRRGSLTSVAHYAGLVHSAVSARRQLTGRREPLGRPEAEAWILSLSDTPGQEIFRLRGEIEVWVSRADLDRCISSDPELSSDNLADDVPLAPFFDSLVPQVVVPGGAVIGRLPRLEGGSTRVMVRPDTVLVQGVEVPLRRGRLHELRVYADELEGAYRWPFLEDESGRAVPGFEQAVWFILCGEWHGASVEAEVDLPSKGSTVSRFHVAPRITLTITALETPPNEIAAFFKELVKGVYRSQALPKKENREVQTELLALSVLDVAAETQGVGGFRSPFFFTGLGRGDRGFAKELLARCQRRGMARGIANSGKQFEKWWNSERAKLDRLEREYESIAAGRPWAEKHLLTIDVSRRNRVMTANEAARRRGSSVGRGVAREPIVVPSGKRFGAVDATRTTRGGPEAAATGAATEEETGGNEG